MIAAKATHNWKRNTLSIENRGRKYTIDLKNQAVSEDLASSASESGGESDDDERKLMEQDEEGVLEIGSCSEDETSSLNGLFHWQMEDYEVFHPDCNMLQVKEGEAEEDKGSTNETFPPEYREYREGMAELDVTPAHKFEQNKIIKYEEPTLKKVNLGESDKPKEILVGDDWDPILKEAAFRIFMEYKDAFCEF